MPELDDRTRILLDRVERATEARRRLAIAYADETGARTERTIRPLGLWFWGKVWTLVAWCEFRDDFRMFRVDRIAGMSEGETFRDEPGKRLGDFYSRHEDRRAD
jgi:predicted DNA-binding transcriptional regulator YafY